MDYGYTCPLYMPAWPQASSCPRGPSKLLLVTHISCWSPLYFMHEPKELAAQLNSWRKWAGRLQLSVGFEYCPHGLHNSMHGRTGAFAIACKLFTASLFIAMH
ncbi:hypothetical protein Dimus_029422, partial [Dionaea muscipula]